MSFVRIMEGEKVKVFKVFVYTFVSFLSVEYFIVFWTDIW